jgi:hypothetical protein
MVADLPQSHSKTLPPGDESEFNAIDNEFFVVKKGDPSTE